MPLHYGLIGHPLGHSLSPFIHRRLFALQGREGSYTLQDLEPSRLKEELPALLEQMAGLNVTIPYKQEVLPFLDTLEGRAALYRSVNTIAVTGNQGRPVYTGYNTDADGFRLSLAAAGIPLEQYESADIDGASRFQKAIYITLPSLLPTAAVLLIMNSGWILNSNLDMFMVFQNSTNQETMEVLDMYIYKYGLKLMDYSYATAAGIVKTGVSLVIPVLVNKGVKKLSDTSIF